MDKKGQSDWVEAVRDAATGYGAVVLGIACFLLALTVVVAGVRVVVGTNASPNATATATATTTAAVPGASAGGTA